MKSDDEQYLIVDVFEAITGEVQNEILRETAKEIKKHNIEKVFADVSKVRNVANIHEHYELGHRVAQNVGFPTDTWDAIFVSPDDHSHDFVETVFLNAGYVCRIFRNKGSAIEWLKRPDNRKK